MDLASILVRLNDLPATYTRSGTTFSWVQAARATGLHKYTNAADGIISQAQFGTAVGNWLDAWGELFNIPRNDGETDSAYLGRIKFLCTVPGGTPASILAFLTEAENLTATLTENFTAVSWAISLSTPLSNARYNQIASDLKYVRPAGVPFSINALRGGLYLGTLNFNGVAPRVTGAFMGNPSTSFAFTIPANTNNAVPALPTIFLTDPTINPSLAS